jgi:hypothetical protein
MKCSLRPGKGLKSEPPGHPKKIPFLTHRFLIVNLRGWRSPRPFLLRVSIEMFMPADYCY